MDKNVEASAMESTPVDRRRGGRTSWDAGDDLCPPWWPRRSRPRRPPRAGEEPVDRRAADRFYAALSYLATTFVIGEEALAREIRLVALAHLRDSAEVLAGGAPRAWEPGDDVCPPWPWGRVVAAGAAAADGHGSRGEREAAGPLPPRAGALLDGINLVQAYALAAKYVDPAPRAATTMAIGRALVEHADLLSRSFP